MTPLMAVVLVGVFVTVALIAGAAASVVLARSSPERRRLRDLAAAGSVSGAGAVDVRLTEQVKSPLVERLAAAVPKSPKEMGRLRRRLGKAGYRSMTAAVMYATAELVLPVIFALAVVATFGVTRGALFAVLAAVVGYMVPGLWLMTRISARQKQITNGLPDALDLLIVCVEAGSALDQAIVKASEELAIAYPALAEELRLITMETKAGKPRMEAFKNFAERTGAEDVRALVTMLIQTDKFGTSIAQALRTHAEVARTKRRQRAEERAAKLGVKLVFPLVFCLFPALYIVILGPAMIKIMRVFGEDIVNR
jgi:tight adherence protein C